MLVVASTTMHGEVLGQDSDARRHFGQRPGGCQIVPKIDDPGVTHARVPLTSRMERSGAALRSRPPSLHEVCIVAVLADMEIHEEWIESDDVLEKLLEYVQLDDWIMEELQAVCRRYRAESRGGDVVTHADVDRVLGCIERLWSEVQSQVVPEASEWRSLDELIRSRLPS